MGTPPRRRPALGLGLGLGLGLVCVLGWVVLDRDARRPGRETARTGARRPDATSFETAPLLPPERAEPEPVQVTSSARSAASDAVAPQTGTETPRAEAEPTPAVDPLSDPKNRLDVLVLDSAGSPAPGIPVRIDVQTETPSSGPRASSRQTDADGRVVLHLGTGDRTVLQGGATFVLRTGLVLEGAPELDLGPAPRLPQAPTLQLPPAGRLQVEVLDWMDEPVSGDATVTVRRDPDTRESPSYPAVDVRDGVAELSWVDLGRTLEIQGCYEGGRGGKASLVVDGPRSDGELVHATLRLAEAWPVIALRAVDGNGMALGWTTLRIRVTQEPLSPQNVRLTTDREGRADFVHYGTHWPKHPRWLEIESEGASGTAYVDLNFDLASGGPTDLGTVALTAQAGGLLASGTVRDERGPVAAARVVLEDEESSITDRRETTTDAGGRFEFLGLPKRGRLGLSARSERHVGEASVVVEAGTRGIELELRRGVVLEVEPLLDAGVSGIGLWLQATSLEQDGDSAGVALSKTARLALPPGRFELEVRTQEGFLVRRIGEILLQPDGAPDPRLVPLDLRGQLRTARFRLLDGRGESLRRQKMTIRAGGEEHQLLAPENLVLVLPARWSEVELAPEGFEPRVVPVSGSILEVGFTPR